MPKGIYFRTEKHKNSLGKHWNLSEETKKKISQSRLGIKFSEKTKKKMSISSIGKKKSKIHCKNISIAKKGTIFTKEHKQKISIANKNKWITRWNNLTYRGKHYRISILYGKADKCENINCQNRNPKRYEWANISGNYLEDKKDWIKLCVTCHKRMDRL